MTNKREGHERRILALRVERERRKFKRRIADREMAQRHFKWAFMGMILAFLGLFLYTAMR